MASTASSSLDDVLDEVTCWFCDDYVPRWVSVANGTSDEGPEFILQFWGCPLHVATPQITMWVTEPQGVLDLLEMNQSRFATPVTPTPSSPTRA